MKATHELKIARKHFKPIAGLEKRFEIRKNDRNFKEGDTILLKEYHKGKYTGKELLVEIGYILQDFEGLADGYIAFTIYVFSSVSIIKRNT
jgi:hypothetical protein